MLYSKLSVTDNSTGKIVFIILQGFNMCFTVNLFLQMQAMFLQYLVFNELRDNL